MRKLFTLLAALMIVSFASQAQNLPESIEPGDFNNFVLPMPPSPLTQQVLFIGGTDLVQTTETYGNEAGAALAKQWHDFIGFTPATEEEKIAFSERDDSLLIPDGSGLGETNFLGWVSVNHERIQANDRIGDGGGMTVFAIAADAEGNIVIVDQILEDGRQGRFFNVDFVNTVGETGMNCGGITSLADGRIWTAEEWFRYSTNSYFDDGDGVRDTTDFTVSSDIAGNFNGQTINKVDNFNWMVEIDPRQAKAIRKQYNWGRAGFEGGVVMPDNQTVYFGEDARPGLFLRFIADTPGDFTSGTLSYYAYDEEAERAYWVDYDNTTFEQTAAMNAYNTIEFGGGPSTGQNVKGALPWRGEDAAAMFIRNEWFAADTTTGIVYWAETGNSSFWDEFALFTPRANGPNNVGSDAYVAVGPDGEPTNFNGKIGSWTLEMARMRFPELRNESNDSVRNWLVQGNNFRDAHGRVLAYDPATEQTYVFLEGGPYPGDDNRASAELGNGYPDKHFSNPDGLNFMYVGDKTYAILCEDLNQNDWNSTPAGVSNRTCELYLYDMDNYVPGEVVDINDLVRISTVPNGAEVTGAQPAGSNTLMVNSQHPSSSNPFPFNNSLTYAINGFDKLAEANDIQITSVRLVDAATQETIGTIDNGDTYTISNVAGRELTIVAETEGEVGSVHIQLSGALMMGKVENFAPYGLFGDSNEGAGSTFNGGSLVAGEYLLTVTPYTEVLRGGAAGAPVVLSFTINDPASEARTTVANNDLYIESISNLSQEVTFNKPTNIGIYSVDGKLQRVLRETRVANISEYTDKNAFVILRAEGNEGVKSFKVQIQE